MPNIFREAKHLLATKKESEMTDEERNTVTAAMIPLNHRDTAFPDNITVAEGLEMLARIAEEANEKAG